MEEATPPLTSSQNNRRIAKNTMMLYVRMILVMLISLYTSRVVLNTLGVEDYGIYNVVGGVIGLLGFITSSMSSATSRFLTYSLGKNDIDELKEVFKAANTTHLVLAIIILIIAETIGLWFLENKLVIPEERMSASRFVYHNMVASAFLSIIQIPYTASVISNEKMNVYAIIEIILAFLRLGIVLLLIEIPYDKLTSYSFLLLGVNIASIIMYIIYTSNRFIECKYKLSNKIEFIKPMIYFSGWDLYGNMSVVARTQGVNILLNMFFGPLLNAANGIAVSVQGAISSFSNNILTAVRPQIVKSHAQAKNSYMIDLLNQSIKFTSLLLFLLIVPISLEIKFVLKVWLLNVPEYSDILSVLTLCFVLFANISSIIMSAIHATGKIKKSSIVNGTLYLSVLPITYFLFKLGSSPVLPYVYNIFAVVAGSILNMFYLKSYLPQFSIRQTVINNILPVFTVGFIAFVISYLIRLVFFEGWLRLLITVAISSFVILSLTYVFLLSKEQRKMAIEKISKK